MLLKSLAAGVLAVACALAAPASAQEVTRQLSHIKGDVWRFQNKFHYSVVINTSEGVVVTDPINDDAAKWLANIIASRFAKPVIYLVYSHSHLDHAAGGEYFADTATVIVQENVPPTVFGVTPDVRFADEMTFTAGDHTFERAVVDMAAAAGAGPAHDGDVHRAEHRRFQRGILRAEGRSVCLQRAQIETRRHIRMQVHEVPRGYGVGGRS